MPKKNTAWGVNTKSAEARERKASQKKEEQSAKKKAVEDEYWKDDDKLDTRKKERKVNISFVSANKCNKILVTNVITSTDIANKSFFTLQHTLLPFYACWWILAAYFY